MSGSPRLVGSASRTAVSTVGPTSAAATPSRIRRRERVGATRPTVVGAGEDVGHDMNVDVAGPGDDRLADACRQRPPPPGPPRGAEQDLRGVDPRAKARMAVARSSPVTVWKAPPSSSVRRLFAVSDSSEGPVSPSAVET